MVKCLNHQKNRGTSLWNFILILQPISSSSYFVEMAITGQASKRYAFQVNLADEYIGGSGYATLSISNKINVCRQRLRGMMRPFAGLHQLGGR